MMVVDEIAAREDATQFLLRLLELAIDELHHDLVRAWIASRSTGDDGFLTIAGALCMRPSALATGLETFMALSEHRRRQLQWRIRCAEAGQ